MNLTAKIRQLAAHPGFVKYFKNTSWMMGERVLRMAAGLFVGIWVARYLGPDRFGLLSYAQSLVGLFAAIAALGLDGIVVRELVKDPKRERELLGTAFVLKLFGAVLTLLVLYIAIHFTSNDSYTNLLVFIIASGVIFQSFNVVDMYFQAKVMSRYAVFAKVTALVLSSIVKIVLILLQAPLEAFAWMVVFDGAVLAAGYLYWYFRSSGEFLLKRLSFRWTQARRLLRDSWPLILSGMVVAVYMKIDQVMIKEMLGNEAVGNYAAAVRLSEAWYFVPMVVSTSLFPAIVNAKKVSEELYYKRLQRLYDLMVLIAVSIALPMTFLSDWIIELLYGERYLQAGEVLMIHIWAGIFTFLGVANGKWIINEGLMINGLIRTSVGGLTNVLLNFLLIEKLGIVGAAFTTLISYFLANYFLMYFFKETRVCFFQLSRSIFFYNFLR